MTTKIGKEAEELEMLIENMHHGNSEPRPEAEEEIQTMDLVIVEPKEMAVNANEPDYKQNTIDDYTNSRENLNYLIEQGQEILKSALKLAEVAPSPRSIEVAAILLKNLGELSQKLNDVNRDYKELNKPTEEAKEKNVTNNNIFTGSLQELLTMANNEKTVNE